MPRHATVFTAPYMQCESCWNKEVTVKCTEGMRNRHVLWISFKHSSRNHLRGNTSQLITIANTSSKLEVLKTKSTLESTIMWGTKSSNIPWVLSEFLNCCRRSSYSVLDILRSTVTWFPRTRLVLENLLVRLSWESSVSFFFFLWNTSYSIAS